MNKPLTPDEQFVDMAYPVNGLDISEAFDSQHPGTTPQAQNVRTFEAITLRARGGSRCGLSKHINQTPGNLGSVIQHLAVIVDPAAEALSANFDIDPPPSWFLITDPSTNNVGGMLGPAYNRNYSRPVRVGGNGHQHNRRVPSAAPTKKMPDIIWSDPADMNDGDVLSAAQLNAIAEDPDTHVSLTGTFDYIPAAGTVMTEGNGQPLRVNFTPDNTVGYYSTSKTVHVDVVNPSIAFAEISGLAFSGSGTKTLTNVNVEAGQLILVMVYTISSTSGLTFTASDDAGNTYTRIDTYVREPFLGGTQELSLSLFWAVAATTATISISYTLASNADSAIQAIRFTGVDAVSPIRAFAANSDHDTGGGYTDPASTGSIGASADDGIVVMGHSEDSGFSTAPAGYTAPTNGVYYKTTGVAGAENFQINGVSNKIVWALMGLALRPA